MRVLVCGGRSFGVVMKGCPADPNHEHRVRAARDAFLITETLDTFHVDHGITCLIHGAATGVDSAAGRWAARKLIPVVSYPAAWNDIHRPGAVIRRNRSGRPYDAAAGPHRNARMLAEGRPDVIIAFPGGSGTSSMIGLAIDAGVAVQRITC